MSRTTVHTSYNNETKILPKPPRHILEKSSIQIISRGVVGNHGIPLIFPFVWSPDAWNSWFWPLHSNADLPICLWTCSWVWFYAQALTLVNLSVVKFGMCEHTFSYIFGVSCGAFFDEAMRKSRRNDREPPYLPQNLRFVARKPKTSPDKCLEQISIPKQLRYYYFC